MRKHPAYLEPLNPEQREAVLHTGKPLLILAGAGSGKTRVITTKIAWLIGEMKMDPRSILAVTFTNKAAREMSERARAIDGRAEGAMLRTFHSFGAWFLRRNGAQAGLSSDFIIYDDDDVVSLLSTIMEDTPKAEVKKCAYSIARAKDYFLNPEDPMLKMIDTRKKFKTIYARYEERLAQIGNVDFGDLIKKPVEILRNHPEIAARFRDRFKVIMVDEYQDANVAQFHLLNELCGEDTYVCVVGDDDQSIYRFRGAEVKNILEFPSQFSGADVIRLERNYRSTEPILKVANSVVDYNHGRLGKTLRAEKGDGTKPVLAYLSDQDAETSYCAALIENSVKKKETAWSDWAILYRTNAQSFGFETLFLRKGIPYRVVGSLKFYEREEIKDALALLSFLVNPRDEVNFRRIVNKPARGIGLVTIDKIIDKAISSGGDLLKACGEIDVAKKARAGIDAFVKVIETGKLTLAEPQSRNGRKENKLSMCITQLIKDSGLEKYHKEQDDISGNSKIGNLNELVNAASMYELNIEGLLKFLEDIELDRSMADSSNEQQDAVTLITFHNTKGLEFKRVIMTGLEHGIFPREDKKDEELEEERRLFYVGATRAMDALYLTNCAQRRMYGRIMPTQPSLFLREIDRNLIEIDNKTYETGYRYSQNFTQFAQAKTQRHEGRKSAGSFPKTFNPLNLSAAAPSAAEKTAALEELAGYKKGDRILHEHHGFGAVVKLKEGEEGPLVYVRFDSGKEVFFNSAKYGRAFERITEDF